MNNKKSDRWDKHEKENDRGLRSGSTSYSGSYPYLSKKATIVIVAIGFLMAVGMINGIMNPAPRYLPTAQEIEALSCLELQEFLEKNVGNHRVGMSSWVEVATLKFLDECSSYGGLTD